MSSFIDFWIDADTSVLEELVDYARMLGYYILCVEDKGFEWKVIKKKGVRLVKRITIVEDSEKSLKERLRGIKVDYPVVVVKPTGIQSARLAARDGRVDAIVLDSESIHYIDKTQASMMKRSGKPLEVPINSFVKSSRRVKAMIYRRLYLFYQYGVPVIYSSCARDWNKLVHPKGVVSLIKTLISIDYRNVLLSLSDIPREVLVRNGVRV